VSSSEKKEAGINSLNSKSAQILVVGPGRMGTGVALAFAQNGFPVILVGRSETSLEKGMGQIDQSLKEGVEKGVFTEGEAAKIKERILARRGEPEAREREALKMAIEAIEEDFLAKSQFLAYLDSWLPPSVILATLTSSLDAELLSSKLTRPERFIWTHFFYPAQKNRTVEVGRLTSTSARTMDMTVDILRQARREVIILKKYRRGGVANIILMSLILEAFRLVDEGYEASVIDEASRLAFGSSFGFISLLSLVGGSMALAVATSLSRASHPSDPILKTYDNFFELPSRLKELLEREGMDGLQAFLMGSKESKKYDSSLEPLVLDLARQRFQAVVFMTSTEVVEAGLIDPPSCDRLCQLAFGWSEGPFSLMNRLGPEASLRLVTERMELSHRREINFPVPRLLIEKAQKNELWPLT